LQRAAAKVSERGLTFELSFDEYAELVSAPCTYCGGPLPEVGLGLDRLDNNVGYTRFNCVPCCHYCNTARSNHFSVSEMVKIGQLFRELRLARPDPSTWNSSEPLRAKASKPAKASAKATVTASEFAERFITAEPQPKAAVLVAAKATGIGKDTARDLLAAAEAAGLVFVWWPPRGHRIKHYANRPYDGRVGFCTAGPGEAGPPLEQVEVA
jgi:hypothetical protein